MRAPQTPSKAPSSYVRTPIVDSSESVSRSRKKGPIARFKDGWCGFCVHINENPKNWVPVFALICLSFFCIFVRNDSDMWFLIANGREIFENGFPHEDYISMHDGLHFVLQQWLVCIADAFFFDTFGEAGLAAWIVLVMCGCACAMAWCVYLKSDGDWAVVCWLTTLGMIIVSWLGSSPRPMIFSVISVLLLGACFEMWKRTSKSRWILAVIGVSLFQANTHATFWPATFSMLVLYAIATNASGTRSKESIESSIAMVFGFAIAGLCNPYGYESIGQVFYTIGYSDVYSRIVEMQPLAFDTFMVWVVPLVIASIVHRRHVPFKSMGVLCKCDLLMACATFAMTFLVARSVIFFEACIVMWMAGVRRANRLNVIERDDPMPFMGKLLCVILAAFSVCGFVVRVDSLDAGVYGTERQREGFAIIDEFFDQEDVSGRSVLSTDLTHGQFLYARYGMRPFVDARLETYLASVNGKADIMREYDEALDGDANAILSLMDAYDIDYLIMYSSDERLDEVSSVIPIVCDGNAVKVLSSE